MDEALIILAFFSNRKGDLAILGQNPTVVYNLDLRGIIGKHKSYLIRMSEMRLKGSITDIQFKTGVKNVIDSWNNVQQQFVKTLCEKEKD